VHITGQKQQNYRVRWAVTAGIVVLSTLSGMRLQAAPVEAPLTVPLNEEAAAEVERPTPDNPGAALARARKVRFLFEVKCEPCHGRKEQKGEFDVRTMASLLKGGKSGPALVRGDAEASLLFRRIADDQMPPRAVRYKLSIKSVTVPELAMIRAWIDEGAVDPPPQPGVVEDDGLLVSDEDKTWWAFQKPVQPAIPVVAASPRARTPIDAFILRKLEAKGLDLSPEADRRVLMRRVSFDLVGIPPGPEEMEVFSRDESPEAYERLVDRLLASPHYGERWGQHWLDAAGYADSEGGNNADTINPEMYLYRDYVIRAGNSDKPYDRFLLEQLAGDELADYSEVQRMSPELTDNLIATTYLRTCIDQTSIPETNFLYDRYQVLADVVEIVSSSLMGLTMRCARCHDHKYDPLPQRDYYRFQAIFAAAYSPTDWVKPDERKVVLVGLAERKEIDEHNTALSKKLEPFQSELDEITGSFKNRLLAQQLAALPEALRAGIGKALAFSARLGKEPPADPKRLSRLYPEFKKESERLDQEIAGLESTRKTVPTARGLTDMEPAALPFYLLERGDWNKRGRRVLPNVPAVLGSAESSFSVERPVNAATTGSRLALARWLIHPDHPLTARVFVNRVWQHHFGVGIVPTADDFGKTGSRPTHPELLDWLAVNFVRQGWSPKKLHRLIVTSAVYRQQSSLRTESVAVDPENVLLWRMPLRRMDAEVIRDSMLAVAGKLNPRMFGPPSSISRMPDGQIHTEDTPGNYRRSIYMLHRRSQPLTFLETFDAPRISTNCIQRRTSNVVSQALLMLNGDFSDRQAAQLAEVIVLRAGDEATAQMELAYRSVLGRPPDASEQALGLRFLEDQQTRYGASGASPPAETGGPEGEKAGLQGEEAGPEAKKWTAASAALVDLCLVLFNSAEFQYID
jgi:hypothetical protein